MNDYDIIEILKDFLCTEDISFNNKDYVCSEKLYNNYEIYEEEIFHFKTKMKYLNYKCYESLVEKIIRFQPLFINFENRFEDSERILTILLIEILTRDDNMCLSEILKKLAILSVRDSYLNSINTYKLLCYSYIIGKSYCILDFKTILWIINISIYMLNSRTYYEYKMDLPLTYNNNTTLEKCSILLYELKGSIKDLLVFKNVSKKEILKESSNDRPDIMNFEYLIDSSCIPEIIYIYKDTSVYKEIMYNPRKTNNFYIEDNTIFFKKQVLKFLQENRIILGEYVNKYFTTFYKNKLINIRNIDYIKYDINNHIIPKSIHIKWKKYYNKLINQTDKDIIKIVLQHLKKDININNFIIFENYKVYNFLSEFCHIFPQALSPVNYKICHYYSKNVYLLQRLVENMIKKIL